MKKTWMRAGVALAAASAMALGMAGTASAEEPITAIPSAESGWKVHGGEGSSAGNMSASRISLTTPDGTKTPVYCIDLFTKLDLTHKYKEDNWENSGVANLGQVQWILHNSYPNVAAADLAKAAEVDTAGVEGDVLDQAAYTATQAAIWTKTDGFALKDGDSTDQSDNLDAVVSGITKYLVDNATDMPEPTGEIKLDGPEQWDASEKSQAFTITTPGATAKLKAEGAKIVDADDEELSEVKSGQEFFLIPNDDADKIKLTATSAFSKATGSVFTTTGEPAKESRKLKNADSQRLILAKSLPGETGAEWEFTLDTDTTLPVTGMSMTNSLLAGGALLLVGAAVVFVLRRRRVAASWGDA